VRSLAISSNGHIYAGTTLSGVVRSTDNGSTWTSINKGLTNTYVGSLAIGASKYVFAGTRGSGIFRSVQPATSGK